MPYTPSVDLSLPAVTSADLLWLATTLFLMAHFASALPHGRATAPVANLFTPLVRSEIITGNCRHVRVCVAIEVHVLRRFCAVRTVALCAGETLAVPVVTVFAFERWICV